MSKEVIHYDVSKLGVLHCDHCNFTAEKVVAFNESIIGTPCPCCGASMVTRAVYEKTARMLRFIDRFNRVFGPLFGKEYADDNPKFGRLTAKVSEESIDVEMSETEDKDEGAAATGCMLLIGITCLCFGVGYALGAAWGWAALGGTLITVAMLILRAERK